MCNFLEIIRSVSIITKLIPPSLPLRERSPRFEWPLCGLEPEPKGQASPNSSAVRKSTSFLEFWARCQEKLLNDFEICKKKKKGLPGVLSGVTSCSFGLWGLGTILQLHKLLKTDHPANDALFT